MVYFHALFVYIKVIDIFETWLFLVYFQLGDLIYVAGQIGMCPADLSIISGGVGPQARLSLRHVERVLEAMHHGTGLHQLLLVVCYVTNKSYIKTAQQELTKSLASQKVFICFKFLFHPFFQIFCMFMKVACLFMM